MGLIAWVDLECTGKDEKLDPILEWGMILTSSDTDFQVITERNWIVRPKNVEYAEERMKNGGGDKPDYVWNMHTGNGLWQMCLDEGRPLAEVEEEANALLTQFNPKKGGMVTLGGSGVAQYDYRFLQRQAPKFAERMNYFTYDIGCVRRIAMLSGVRAPAEASDGGLKSHRAIDDIKMHLAEARWFARFFAAGKREGIVQDLRAEDAELEDMV